MQHLSHMLAWMFGPFVTKKDRKQLKCCGAIFTCLASWAIHLEAVNSTNTDSFIMCLRRFIGCRGNVRMLSSDNASNFTGAEKELSKGFLEMDRSKIRRFLQNLGSNQIIWKKNPPARRHFDGIWEHQIRSARAVLGSLFRTHGSSLNDEGLITLMIEVEVLVSSRPLTIETIADGTNEDAISHSDLLTMKSKVGMPSPGSFGTPDHYSRRRWRRTQHIVNKFWSRWRKKFPTSLQVRSKWSKSRRNLTVGDIVLLKT